MSNWRDVPITLSFAENKWANAFNDHKYTPRRLVEEKLSKHHVLPEKGLYGFSCELINDSERVNEAGARKGKNLRNDNAASWAVLVYDMDQGQPYEEATRKLRDDGIAFSSYSSWSHMRSASGSIPKYRIVIFLRKPYKFDADDHALCREVCSAAYLAVGEQFGFKFDNSCKNAASLFYLPSHDGSEEARKYAFCDRSGFDSGEPLDFAPYVDVARTAIIEKRDEAQAKKKAKEKRAEKKRAASATYQTLDMDTFISRCGKDFDAKGFVEELFDGHATATGAVEVVCPLSELHSDVIDGKVVESGRNLFVLNAGDPNGKGEEHMAPFVDCNHEHKHGKPTTWEWIDLLCVQNGFTVKTLLQFVPEDARKRFEVNRGLPPGYRRDGGRIRGVTIGKEAVEIDICQDFNVNGRIRNADDQDWGIEIAFENEDGKLVSAVIHDSELHGDGTPLRTRLANKGFSINVLPAARIPFNMLMSQLKARKRIVTVYQPGWYGEGDAMVFVCPSGKVIFAGPQSDIEYRLVSGDVPKDGETRGTLEEWKNEIGESVWHQDTPHFVLGLASGVAGTILELLGEPSCGLGFGGETSRGKSTAQYIGGSCWGDTKPGACVVVIPRATANQIENQMKRGNGASLHFDDDKAATSDKDIANIPYLVAGGTGKERMTKDCGERPVARWTTFATMSSERARGRQHERYGEPLMGGAMVRFPWIDVSHLPSIQPNDAKTIKDATRRFNGTAGPAFVRELIRQGYHRDPDQLRERWAKIEHEIGAASMPPAHQRTRRIFALLWLVLDIMRDAALIPKGSLVRDVVAWGWENFLGSREAETLSPAHESVEAMILWFKSNPAQCVSLQHNYGHDILAWHDSTTVYVPKRNLMRIPCVTASSERAIVKELKRRGLLIEVERQDGRKENIHNFVPGGPGYERHYRIALRVVSAGESGQEQALIDETAIDDALTRFRDNVNALIRAAKTPHCVAADSGARIADST